jgi:hypothetical protein
MTQRDLLYYLGDLPIYSVVVFMGYADIKIGAHKWLHIADNSVQTNRSLAREVFDTMSVLVSPLELYVYITSGFSVLKLKPNNKM